MTVIMMEGFESAGYTYLAAKGWSGYTYDQQPGRLGGKSMLGNQTGFPKHSFPGGAAYDTLICGFGWAANWGADPGPVVRFLSNGSAVASVGTTTAGSNVVFYLMNAAGNWVAQGSTPYVSSTWVYIELKVFRSATVGTLELRLNGSLTAECSATGLNLGASNINAIGWQQWNGRSEWLDDVYVLDPTTGSAPTNDWLGECRVETLFPNGNGANTAWTGTYADVDEPNSPDGDTTYIYSNTPGQIETDTFTDLSVTTGTVFAVQTHIVARKDNAGLRTIAPVMRVGGVDYVGTTSPALPTGYTGVTQLYDRVDPSGADWTVATANAIEAGVKEVG